VDNPVDNLWITSSLWITPFVGNVLPTELPTRNALILKGKIAKKGICGQDSGKVEVDATAWGFERLYARRFT